MNASSVNGVFPSDVRVAPIIQNMSVGQLADTYCPPREPFFSGCISTVILSPAFMESAFQPALAIWPREAISNDQSAAFPAASVAMRHKCLPDLA